MAIQTLRISELIKELQALKQQLGDVPVIHQRDPEGNGFGTIDKSTVSYYDDTEIGVVAVIFPYDEDIEEEVFGCCY